MKKGFFSVHKSRVLLLQFLQSFCCLTDATFNKGVAIPGNHYIKANRSDMAIVLGRSRYVLLMSLVFMIDELSVAIHVPSSFDRTSFPDGFLFGAASSAYQYEGAAREEGRGPSIWDVFTHQNPDKISDSSTGDVAVDFYHRYKEDIRTLKKLGMDAFRFSISWPRLLPRGKISAGVNEEGVKFYRSVIDEVISNGLTPFVTLFHWDAPQALEDEYGGFLNEKIVNDFRDYTELCFKEFGDQVKHWITLNEPSSYSKDGYDNGIYAPNRCSKYAGNCSDGNSATEPYIVAHNMLLAHAASVNAYKKKYQMSQKGEIGITITTHWFKPKSETKEDLKASYTALDFYLGWFLHPITYGDYPSTMHTLVGKRLPKFSKEQSKMLKGSKDFLGLNYYTSDYASPSNSIDNVNLSYSTDSHVNITNDKDGIPIGQPTALSWLFFCPSGIQELVLYVKDLYNNPVIYITENGMADENNNTMAVEEAVRDKLRIRYYKEHLWYLKQAIEKGAKVKGHFAWSLLDNFEWETGYSFRFGLYYVDYKNGLRRYPKDSAIWYEKFLQGRSLINCH